MKPNKSKINRLLDSDYFASYQLLHLNGACLCPPRQENVLHNCCSVQRKQNNMNNMHKKVHISEHAFAKLKCILPLIHILIACKKGNKLRFEFRVFAHNRSHSSVASLPLGLCYSKLTARAGELKSDSLHLHTQHLSIITSQYFLPQYHSLCQ